MNIEKLKQGAKIIIEFNSKKDLTIKTDKITAAQSIETLTYFANDILERFYKKQLILDFKDIEDKK